MLGIGLAVSHLAGSLGFLPLQARVIAVFQETTTLAASARIFSEATGSMAKLSFSMALRSASSIAEAANLATVSIPFWYSSPWISEETLWWTSRNRRLAS